jgi:biopolymer transport protein ExbD
MAKVKISKKSTKIDMTAMCDVAFLLLSFFIMTSTAKVPEPKPVDTPASTVQAKLPEHDLATITIGDSAVYFSMTDRDLRVKALEIMADKYGIEAVYNVCAFMPLLGLVACFLPNLKRR